MWPSAAISCSYDGVSLASKPEIGIGPLLFIFPSANEGARLAGLQLASRLRVLKNNGFVHIERNCQGAMLFLVCKPVG